VTQRVTQIQHRFCQQPANDRARDQPLKTIRRLQVGEEAFSLP